MGSYERYWQLPNNIKDGKYIIWIYLWYFRYQGFDNWASMGIEDVLKSMGYTNNSVNKHKIKWARLIEEEIGEYFEVEKRGAYVLRIKEKEWIPASAMNPDGIVWSQIWVKELEILAKLNYVESSIWYQIRKGTFASKTKRGNGRFLTDGIRKAARQVGCEDKRLKETLDKLVEMELFEKDSDDGTWNLHRNLLRGKEN